jgi:hypothetical protein
LFISHTSIIFFLPSFNQLSDEVYRLGQPSIQKTGDRIYD